MVIESSSFALYKEKLEWKVDENMIGLISQHKQQMWTLNLILDSLFKSGSFISSSS